MSIKATALSIVEQLSEADPLREDASGFFTRCILCHSATEDIAFTPEGFPHDAGCAWVRARRLMERRRTEAEARRAFREAGG